MLEPSTTFRYILFHSITFKTFLQQSLRITGSVLSDSEFRLLLDCCPDGTILNSSDIKRDGNDERFTEKELRGAFPSVKFVQPSLYPIGRTNC